MKKNDAIEILAGYISTHNVFSDTHPKDLIDIATHILKGVENIGMLPPKISKNIVRFETPDDDEHGEVCFVIRTINETIEVSEWEKD